MTRPISEKFTKKGGKLLWNESENQLLRKRGGGARDLRINHPAASGRGIEKTLIKS
jgi:hypothetical protein